MPLIYVCPKSQVPDAAERLRPSHLITLLDPRDDMPTPECVPPQRHLRLGLNDVVQALPDHTPPDEQHVREIIAFAETWDRARPMLVHCWAGISRSTATAYAIACMLNKHGAEERIALALRAASPYAYPNARIVALADHLLKRDGRMVDALDRMGPAQAAYESQLFGLRLDH
jgi:predicted protein tyrosine phosphatase